jgi:hypothetical protein
MQESIKPQLDMFEEIKRAFWKLFPDSSITVSNSALGGSTKFIHVYLGRDINEMPNRIAGNDPFGVVFIISEKDCMIECEPRMRIDRLKPTEQYYAMDSEKIRTRKFRGDEQKMVDNITKMLIKLRDKVIELDTNDRFLPGLAYNISDKVTQS